MKVYRTQESAQRIRLESNSLEKIIRQEICGKDVASVIEDISQDQLKSDILSS